MLFFFLALFSTCIIWLGYPFLIRGWGDCPFDNQEISIGKEIATALMEEDQGWWNRCQLKFRSIWITLDEQFFSEVYMFHQKLWDFVEKQGKNTKKIEIPTGPCWQLPPNTGEIFFKWDMLSSKSLASIWCAKKYVPPRPSGRQGMICDWPFYCFSHKRAKNTQKNRNSKRTLLAATPKYRWNFF